MEFFKSESFGSHVEELMRQNHVPGFSIAIVQDGQVASSAYGFATPDPETPCTADSLFDIASTSKSFTAASVALLVDDNEAFPEVQYDAVMSKLLPDDFVMPSPTYTEGVMLDDLLGHTTGMPGHNDTILGAQSSCPDTARSITRNLRNLPAVAPLRSRYIYNNMMYTVLTHLVEVKSGQSFGDFLHSNLFQPLGMISTNLQPSRARSKGLGERMGIGHYWDKDASAYFEIPIQDCPESQGAGSIVSSANDLILWVKALLNREGPITDKVYQGITRMRSFRDPCPRRPKKWTSPGFYAAGLEIYYYRGYAVVFHDGNVSGFASRILFVPELRFGACMIGNAGGAVSVIGILVRELLDEVLHVPVGERLSQDKGKKVGTSGSKKKPANAAKGSKQTLPYVGSRLVAKQKSSKSWPQPDVDLLSYTGVYSHPGYHDMTVQIVDAGLFIDASDRSTGFTLSFEHIANQIKFIAHLCDIQEGGDDHVEAEFVMQDGRAIKLGLDLVPALKQLIWFEKNDSKG